MKKHLTVAALAIAIAAPAGMLSVKAHAAQPAQTAQYVQERPWDQAPDDYRDAQREGFREGIEAARHDWQERKHKDADDHERYKHPPVEREFRDQYREGFKHGYSEAMHHMKDMHNEGHHDHDD